jgi:hypothetical protein
MERPIDRPWGGSIVVPASLLLLGSGLLTAVYGVRCRR